MKKVQESMASPTTTTKFVKANTSNFRELVQRLTSSSEIEVRDEVAATQKMKGVKRSTTELKLHERRQYPKYKKLEIVKPPLPPFHFKSASSSAPASSFVSPFLPVCSPCKSSKSDFIETPSKPFSNLSIFEQVKERQLHDIINTEEEDKAIKGRRFFLHPSPRSRAGNAEPQLLSLFPLTSPKSS